MDLNTIMNRAETRKMNFQSKIKIFHISVIFIGSLILFGGCFQNSLWFDEAYSVGMMEQDVRGILKWSSGDVHPPLYYLMLKLFTWVFGKSLYAMRIFSASGAVLLPLLGYTHVRKDFNENIGFWFSFCTLFCGSSVVYGLQIRMYTWAAFFVALTALFGHRLFQKSDIRKNSILFVASSVLAAYTHYFALFAVAAINIWLLSGVGKDKAALRNWLLNAVVQITLYIPGTLVFLHQIKLGGADWITVDFPDLIFDFVSYYFTGDVLKGIFEYKQTAYFVAGGLFLAIFVSGVCALYRIFRNDIGDRTVKAVKSALGIYFSVILFSLTVSLFRPVYYARYTVVLMGLLSFGIAVLMSSLKHKTVKALTVAFLLAVFALRTFDYYGIMYDHSADSVKQTLDEKMQEDDVFLFDNANGYVITVQYPENAAYFYNQWGWNVQDAYRAFGKESYVLDSLECKEIEELGERVWTVGRGTCYDKLLSLGYKEIESHDLYLRYHDNSFQVILMEKQL